MAPNAEQWLAGVQSIYGCTTNVNPNLLTTPSLTPSLYDLFQDFLHDNLNRRQTNLEPQQMRLLLHPLQSLLCHLRQMLSCFSDVLGARRSAGRTVTKTSTNQRLEEVQGLLQKWYERAMAQHKADPSCALTQCNLVMYHLISLNAVTSFPEVERLARKEGFEAGGPTYWELSLRHKRCIHQREEAIFHCGQVLRLLRGMSADRQPSWWGAAVYRVVMVLWVDGLGRLDPSFNSARATSVAGSTTPNTNINASTVSSPSLSPRTLSTSSSSNAGSSDERLSPAPITASASPMLVSSSQHGKFAVDQVTPENPAVVAYLWGGEGIPMITRGDGAVISLDDPSEVLSLGIKTLQAGVSTRVGDGLKRKLVTLAGNWSLDSIGVGPAVVA